MITKRYAQIFLVLFDALSLYCIYLLFHEHSVIITSIEQKSIAIQMDTADYYLILGTFFPLIRFLQLIMILFIRDRKKQEKLWLNLIFVSWFCLSVVFANMAPLYMDRKIQKAGYHYCGDKPDHRVGRGVIKMYRLDGCGSDEGSHRP